MANPDNLMRLGSTLFRVEEEGAWIQLDLAHERIHLGQVYSGSGYSASIANGGTVSLALTAGAAQPHFLPNVAAGGNALLRIYEGGSVTGGAAVTWRNRNRGVAGTPEASLIYGGTVTGGTILYREFLPGGAGGQKIGGSARSVNEFVGAVNTLYTIELVNNSGGAAAVSLDVEVYEVSEV